MIQKVKHFFNFILGPVERIELPQADLEAAVLPLYYTGTGGRMAESNPWLSLARSAFKTDALSPSA